MGSIVMKKLSKAKDSMRISAFIFLLASSTIVEAVTYQTVDGGRPYSSGGADLAIVSIKKIGEVKVGDRTLFEVTVQNKGTSKANNLYIKSYFYKNGHKYAFRLSNGGSMNKELLPGETEKVSVKVEFEKTTTERTSSFSEIPTRYFDNVLNLSGNNTIGFIIHNNNSANIDNNLSNNEKQITIKYDFSANKPRISQFINTLNVYSSQHQQQHGIRDYRYKLGWKVETRLSARDDVNITKASLEYRIYESSPWKLIEEVHVNKESLHSMKPWRIPNSDDHITMSMQLRLKVYNSPTVFTEKLSPMMKVFKNDAAVESANVDKEKYIEGSSIKVAPKVESVYPVKKIDVTLVQDTEEKKIKTIKPEDTKTYSLKNNVIHFNIPKDGKFIGNSAYVKYKVTNNNGTSYTKKSKSFKIFKDSSNTPTPVSSHSILDGAASIISSGEHCPGCNFDIAEMKKHVSTNSTVVFQWLHNEKTCDTLNIVSAQKMEVIIGLKSWAGKFMDKKMKVTLGSKGITLRKADLWTTFSVTSTSPVSSSNRITANCNLANDEFNMGDRTDIEAHELPKLVDGFVWTGTGSLITTAKRNTEEGDFGLTLDYTATSKDKKSLTTFQWRSSDSCKKIELYDEGNSSSAVVVKDVEIKKWNAKNWESAKCEGSLPCTIKATEMKEYYVLKVTSDPSIFSGWLAARCVN